MMASCASHDPHFVGTHTLAAFEQVGGDEVVQARDREVDHSIDTNRRDRGDAIPGDRG